MEILSATGRYRRHYNSILILSETAIGDVIVSTLPIARYFKEKGCMVYGCFASKNSWELMKEIPYFDETFKVEEFKKTPKYDLIYVRNCDRLLKEFEILNLKKKKMIKYNNPIFGNTSRVESIAKQLNIDNFNIQLSINWYNKFYKNFKFPKKTILVNCTSNCSNRNYQYNIVELLSKQFNVVKIDISRNICENLHLINQVEYVLTVDTGILWLAKALNKKTYVIADNAHDSVEKLLDVKILNGKPEDIVVSFLKEINQH